MNNFTPRAQMVLVLAREEAVRLHHHFVGTEHLLLGLIRLDQGAAVNVLKKMGLDLEFLRREVERQVGHGPETEVAEKIPDTPRARKVLKLARKEAPSLNHRYVGTEHLLMGLLCEGEGMAAQVLEQAGLDIERTRLAILKELDPNYLPPEDVSEPSKAPDASRDFRRELAGLARSPGHRLCLVVLSLVSLTFTGGLVWAAHGFAQGEEDMAIKIAGYVLADVFLTLFFLSIFALLWALFTPRWIERALSARANQVLTTAAFMIVGLVIGLIFFFLAQASS